MLALCFTNPGCLGVVRVVMKPRRCLWSCAGDITIKTPLDVRMGVLKHMETPDSLAAHEIMLYALTFAHILPSLLDAFVHVRVELLDATGINGDAHAVKSIQNSAD